MGSSGGHRVGAFGVGLDGRGQGGKRGRPRLGSRAPRARLSAPALPPSPSQCSTGPIQTPLKPPTPQPWTFLLVPEGPEPRRCLEQTGPVRIASELSVPILSMMQIQKKKTNPDRKKIHVSPDLGDTLSKRDDMVTCCGGRSHNDSHSIPFCPKPIFHSHFGGSGTEERSTNYY